MDLNFATTDQPAQAHTRESAPNPFAGKFPTEEGKAFYVDLPSSTDDENKVVKRVIAQAQTAAREAGYTGRVRRDSVTIGTGKTAKAGTRLTFWSIPKIERKPKGTDTAA